MSFMHWSTEMLHEIVVYKFIIYTDDDNGPGDQTRIKTMQ